MLDKSMNYKLCLVLGHKNIFAETVNRVMFVLSACAWTTLIGAFSV